VLATTRLAPDLIQKLDPKLADDLGREGVHVTGYRLEVVGCFRNPGV